MPVADPLTQRAEEEARRAAQEEALRDVNLQQQKIAAEDARRKQLEQTRASDMVQWAGQNGYAGKGFSAAPPEAREHFINAYPEIAGTAPNAWNQTQRETTGIPGIGLELPEGGTAAVKVGDAAVTVGKPEPGPKYQVIKDEATGRQYRYTPSTNESVPINLDGNQPAADNGGDLMAALSPQEQEIAKGLLSYNLPFSAISARQAGPRLRIIAAVQQADPSWDAKEYNNRAALRKSATSGKISDARRSANTAIGHLNDLAESAKALHNTDIPLLNQPLNYLKKELAGNPAITSFDANVNAVVSELAKFFRGTGGTTVKDIEEWRQAINNSMSPAQIQGSIAKAIQLMGSQLDSFSDQWAQGMKQPRDFTFLDDKSRTILKKLGFDPENIDPVTGRVATAPPGGDRANMPHGQQPAQPQAPQEPADQMPTITTQAQYDALPGGTKYRDSHGTVGVKP